MTIQVPSSYKELFYNNEDPVLFVYGGAGAGKTYQIALKLLLKAIQYPRKILVIRKTFGSVKDTLFSLFCETLQKMGVISQINKSDLVIKIMRSQIFFRGLVYSVNEQKEINRLKGLSDITDIWIDEATELTNDEYYQLTLRLRGNPIYPPRQMIVSFNPTSKSHWLYEYYQQNLGKWFHFTYKDNPFLDPSYIQTLLLIPDSEYRKVYVEGEWGGGEGLVFKNVFVDKNLKKEKIDVNNICYGIDFGFTAPTVCVEVGVDNKNRNIFVFREIYKNNITNTDLIKLLDGFVVNKKRPVFCDNAEPDRILELKRSGFRAIGVKGNVKQSIAMLQTYQIHINPICINTIKEFQSFSYRKVKNTYIDDFVGDDHCIDAVRYAFLGYTNLGTVDIKEFVKMNFYGG